MPDSSDIVILIGFVVVLSIFSYAAYWAFSIRSVLASRLYRNQALGIGLIILSLGFTSLFVIVTQGNQIFIPISWVVTLIIFYWVDASMLAARRTDPLLRDTLRWSKVRFIVLGVNALGIGVTAVVTLATNNFGHGITQYNPNLPTYYLFLLFLPVYATIGSAIAGPSTSARRSGDPALRKHLLWFGISGAVTLGLAITGPFLRVPQLLGIVVVLFAPAYGYCLYRSAKALVPLNRFSELEVARK